MRSGGLRLCAATSTGRFECFELAIDRDERAGALIWAMHHRLRLGETLLARGQAVEALPLLKLVAAGRLTWA